MNVSKTTVVIPTYNGARFIREALESVFAQTLPPDEIVVVDDRSTDNTCELVKASIANSPIPLRLICLDKNSGGPSEPTNIGVEAAAGEIIAVLDQDDMFHPEKLARQVPVLRENPGLAVVFSWSNTMSSHDVNWHLQEAKSLLTAAGIDRGDFLEIPSEVAIETMLRYGTFVRGYPGFIFRRSDFLFKGGASQDLLIASDLELVSWLSTHGGVALVPFDCYSFREHDANACRSRARMWLELAQVWTTMLERQPELLGHHDLLSGRIQVIAEMARSFREGARYTEAIAAHQLLRRLGVPPIHLTIANVKLRLHRILCRIGLKSATGSMYTR